jgi:ketosteroid isomerase-like protein
MSSPGISHLQGPCSCDVAAASIPERREGAGAAWSEWTVEPEDFLDCGDSVVMVFHMKAIGRDSGIALERQDAMVFELRDGKVMRLDYFNSVNEALEAVGPAE